MDRRSDDQAGSPVPRAKVRVPPARGLDRVRLERILGSVFGHRLVLVVAPAGSGKTTLLSHFAAGAGCPVAWYRAETSDGGEEALLRNLGSACAAALEGLRVGWRSVEDAAAALDEHPARQAAIVVDDLHTLHGTPAEAALEQLLGYLPAGIALVAASRRSPAFSLSRLRVQDDLLEIGSDDLRFRAWEVEQLFKVVYDQVLSPSDLSTLTQRTEGWAAGLQLFHLASRGKSAADRHRLVEGLGARARLVREYLADNVLGELPEDLRSFLVATCVLSTLSGELCDELLGRNGGDAVLADLEQRQLFCVPLEEGRYRYHEVLRSHLEAALVEQVGETAARDRYRAAGGLHEKAGEPVGAIRAYCRAEDWDAVGRLLGAQTDVLVGEPGAWVDALPTSVVADDPWLLLASARRAVAHGRLRDASDGYVEAEQAFSGGRGAESARAERAQLRPWTVAQPDRQAGWSGLLRAATIRDAGSVAIDASALGGPLGPFVGGVATVLAGHPDDGQRLLLRAAGHPDAGPILEFAATTAAALAPLWGAAHQVDAGKVEELADALGLPWVQRVASAACALLVPGRRSDGGRRPFDVEPDDWCGALCALHAGLAALRDGTSASVVLEEAAGRLRFLGADLLEVHAQAALAQALVVEGQPGALDTARQAADDARRLGAHGAAVWALLAAAAADPSAAELWVQRARRVALAAGLPEPAPQIASPRPPPPGGVAPLPAQPAATPPIRLRVLGQFRIEVGGQVVDLGAVKPRARAALRLLALHAPRLVHREVLCEALWPEADPESATRNLQVAISSLRQSLEPGVPRGAHTLLVRQGDAYRLALPEGSDSDLVSFHDLFSAGAAAQAAGERQAAITAFEQALTGHGADLLPEDGPAEWVVGARDQVRAGLADVAGRLAALRLEDGDPEAACAAAERGLRADRYRDDLWRRLADAHRARGDLAAAARVERDYASVLVELGVA